MQWKFVSSQNIKWDIFLEISYKECEGETIPKLFFKISKLSISLDQLSKVYTVCFYCMLSWGLWKYIEPKPQKLLKLLPHAILINKKRSGTSLPASFSARFFKINISLVIFYYLTKSHCLVVFTSWDIGQFVYYGYLLTSLWRQKFCIWPYLSNQAVFSKRPRSQDKNLDILRTSSEHEIKSIFQF